MKYLLDADWVISFLNGRANAVELITTLADDGLAISIIAWGEIYEGLLGKPDPERHIAQLTAFTQTVDLLVPEVTTASRYAHLRSVLRARGLLLPDNDLWIAATALVHDLTLVTRDRHFQRIPDLKLYQEG
jgi:predicted nucleic acid-binding protein